jgi:hypothetical protein
MARVQTTRQQIVTGDPSAVFAAIHGAGQRNGCRLEAVRGWELEVRRGSQVTMRLLGILAHARNFPVVAAVRVSPVEAGAVVDVNLLDDLGFGLKTGATKKFGTAANELADLLIVAARSVPDHKRSLRIEPGTFCAHCSGAVSIDARFCAPAGLQQAQLPPTSAYSRSLRSRQSTCF